VEIMLFSICGKSLSKALQYCVKYLIGVLLESYAKTVVIWCYYYWQSIRI